MHSKGYQRTDKRNKYLQQKLSKLESHDNYRKNPGAS